jgi:hypothetical protein
VRGSGAFGVDETRDLTDLGKARERFFGKKQLAVALDLEDAPGAFDQGDRFTGFTFDLVRDTRGMRKVVSHHAISNFPCSHESLLRWLFQRMIMRENGGGIKIKIIGDFGKR